MTKRQILNLVNHLPEKVDIDELIYRLYLKKHLEEAEDDIRNKRILPHAKVMREIERWFK